MRLYSGTVLRLLFIAGIEIERNIKHKKVECKCCDIEICRGTYVGHFVSRIGVALKEIS